MQQSLKDVDIVELLYSGAENSIDYWRESVDYSAQHDSVLDSKWALCGYVCSDLCKSWSKEKKKPQNKLEAALSTDGQLGGRGGA